MINFSNFWEVHWLETRIIARKYLKFKKAFKISGNWIFFYCYCCLHPSVPSPSHTNTWSHLPTAIHKHFVSAPPSCPPRVAGSRVKGWQHGSCDIFHSSSTVQSGTEKKLFPKGDVTRVWRGALLANQRAAEAWQHYLLRPCCSSPPDRQQGRRGTWAGNSSSASRHGGRVCEGEEMGLREIQTQRWWKRINQSAGKKKFGKLCKSFFL